MGIDEANGHIGTDGHWGQWVLGQIGIGGKWAFMRQMGTVEQMGTLGPMDIGAMGGNNGHQEK